MQPEATYLCDHCGEEIVIPIDSSAGSHQEYIEDCPVPLQSDADPCNWMISVTLWKLGARQSQKERLIAEGGKLSTENEYSRLLNSVHGGYCLFLGWYSEPLPPSCLNLDGLNPDGKMKTISILNHVLGPVMRGPSSLTAGAFHIGSMARSLMGGQPTKATFAFDPMALRCNLRGRCRPRICNDHGRPPRMNPLQL